MKKLLALSTLVGTVGLVVFGTVSSQKNELGKEECNEKIVLTSGGSNDGQYSESDVERIRNAFEFVHYGDLWYDSLGENVLGNQTGHIGIVVGVEKDAFNNPLRLKVIESNPKGDEYHEYGVSYGIVTPERFLNQKSKILRVHDANDAAKVKAVEFCRSQIGHPYAPFVCGIPQVNSRKKASEATSDCTWYCSELVWAAYKMSGIDLEEQLDGFIETFCDVSPHEIAARKKNNVILECNPSRTNLDEITVSESFFKCVKPGDFLVNDFYARICFINKVKWSSAKQEYYLEVLYDGESNYTDVYASDFLERELETSVVRINSATPEQIQSVVERIRAKTGNSGTYSVGDYYCPAIVANEFKNAGIDFDDFLHGYEYEWDKYIILRGDVNLSTMREEFALIKPGDLVKTSDGNDYGIVDKVIVNDYHLGGNALLVKTKNSLIEINASTFYSSKFSVFRKNGSITITICKYNEEVVLEKGREDDYHDYLFQKSGKRYYERHDYKERDSKSEKCSVCKKIKWTTCQ